MVKAPKSTVKTKSGVAKPKSAKQMVATAKSQGRNGFSKPKTPK